MDKILLCPNRAGTDASVTVTNDGATILKSVGVDNPAAKVLVGMFFRFFIFRSHELNLEMSLSSTAITVLSTT